MRRNTCIWGRCRGMSARSRGDADRRWMQRYLTVGGSSKIIGASAAHRNMVRRPNANRAAKRDMQRTWVNWPQGPSWCAMGGALMDKVHPLILHDPISREAKTA